MGRQLKEEKAGRHGQRHGVRRQVVPTEIIVDHDSSIILFRGETHAQTLLLRI
jgi:hypothetical protein